MGQAENEIAAFLDRLEVEAAQRYDTVAHLPRLQFARHSFMPLQPSGWHDMAYAVTMDGALAIMRASFALRSAWDANLPGNKSRRDLVIPPGTRAMLSVFDGQVERGTIEFPFLYPFPFFDQLADGSWIVTDNDADGKDVPNACHLGTDGKVLRQFRAGGGISQVQADPDGGFWVGYSDQGIFTGEHGFEQGGVIRFGKDMTPQWQLNDTADSDAGGVGRHLAQCDCSDALNITGAGRWAYTFPGFLLTHFDAPGGPRSLRSMVEFADTVAVGGDQLLLTGMDRSPREGRGFDRLVRLGPPVRWTPRRPRIEWVAAIEQPFAPAAELWTARGDTLHCVSKGMWSRLSIDEADALVPAGAWRFAGTKAPGLLNDGVTR